MKINRIVSICFFMVVPLSIITMDDSYQIKNTVPTKNDSPEYVALVQLQQKAEEIGSEYFSMLLNDQRNPDEKDLYEKLVLIKKQINKKNKEIELWVAIQKLYYYQNKTASITEANEFKQN